MSKLRLTLENSLNDLKDSDGRISMATQAALLMFLITLTLTSASIQKFLATNLDQMLGADLVLETHEPLAPAQENALRGMASGVSRTRLSGITLTHKDAWARVQLKAVDSQYPLEGTLRIADTPASPERTASSGPEVGEIWLGARLATKLQARVGETIMLGGKALTVSAILLHEPDRLMEGHSVDLRAMVHHDSLSATLPTSGKDRTRHLIAGPTDAQAAIEAWATDALPAASIVKKHGGQHPLATFWQRTENFLGLASVILFFLGAVALDMTNRRWLAKMRYRLAIYSSIGTPLGTGIAMALGGWFLSFLLAALLATGLAALAHSAIIANLQTVFPGAEASWSVADVAQTIGLLLMLLMALQIPSMLQLSRASLLSLIRHTGEDSHVWQRLFWGLLSVSLLAAAYSDNWLLTGMTLAAIGVALVLMIALTWGAVRLGDIWGRRRTGLLPFAFFIMRQRLFAKSAQVMGLGLCGLLLLFTLMLMRDLSSMMEGYARTHDGNLMVTEAQENHVEALHDWASANQAKVLTLRPFVYAKLISVNGERLNDYMQKPSDSLASLQEPIRLHWTDQMPANNRLKGGTFWQPGTDNWQQISVEPEVMTDLNFSYGDTLTYQIGDNQYDFTLTSSHVFQSGGGSITFWFQVPASARAHIDAPSRFMGSMELPEAAWDKLASLWQQHPTLALAPLRELTERFDQTLGIVTQITSGYAGMILLLALFVLAASVSGFRADDRQKNGLLMSMGLKDKDCLWLNFHDWAVTALVAAAGAIGGAWAAGLMIYEAQFGMSYQPNLWWVAGTMVLMVTTVCLVGYLACRQSLKVSVRDLMNG
ncbi:ABC transporter permease [Kordiimonas lacus]|uniref:Predicted ABC-type transport system involved in lysophospholipase L1 biosynthesis, permease component n=1 Tax=Kordiimonas lacus TaxID=637679 RepID=A0A1G7A835_9PROT|nr:FtsX-like permease family protein [Kordiimonas lacus]SDE10940.1 Predicted ABC-type transport system involved in lysophospholipase L1 biosynthesis, permease component [Kordiimonas lacus]